MSEDLKILASLAKDRARNFREEQERERSLEVRESQRRVHSWVTKRLPILLRESQGTKITVKLCTEAGLSTRDTTLLAAEIQIATDLHTEIVAMPVCGLGPHVIIHL